MRRRGPGRRVAETQSLAGLDLSGRVAVRDSLVALVGASLSGLPGTGQMPVSSLERFHRERILCIANQRLCEPDLTVEFIAREVRLSPRYVHRLFEAEPITLSAWIWQQRLELSHRILSVPLNGKRAVTDTAYSVGFKDSAHFSRMFKAKYGLSPRDIRPNS
jgi:AraC-like DNA-binding protein